MTPRMSSGPTDAEESQSIPHAFRFCRRADGLGGARDSVTLTWAFDIRGSTFDILGAFVAYKTQAKADPMPEPFRRNPFCMVRFAAEGLKPPVAEVLPEPHGVA